VNPPLYKDAAAPLEQRVADLLSRMTLDEKVQQLRSANGNSVATSGSFDAAKAARVFDGGMGGVSPMTAEVNKEVALRNAAQKYLIEQTRLGIPAMFHDEACHGFRDIGATSFPVPIGLACSWDSELVERIYNVAAGEMRARGVSHALAPVVDICRDPRWGRTDETMGEDPFFNGTLGAAMVRGLQGSADGSIAPGHVAATLKHMAGHGQPEGGINRAPGDVPLREMYDAHLVPFRIAIAQGHPASVMPSYNEVDGVPSHANAWLLGDVLRQTFKFNGVIASDYSGVEYLQEVHHLAGSPTDAAYTAFTAGVDMNLPDGKSYGNLKNLVESGRVSQAELDQAVGRVLRLKFALGLFEHPYGDAKLAAEMPMLDSSKALAREAAQKSIVLLKNRDHLLPLQKEKYKAIAVIGPNAADARLGSYSGDPLYRVSIRDGVQSKLGDPARVLYAQGCNIATNLPVSSFSAWRSNALPLLPSDTQTSASIAEAVAAAKQADLVVLVLGENEMYSRESTGNNRIGDRASLDLPGAQNELADAIFAVGKPVVVYLMNGRPLAIPHIVEKADALLEGWYMGQETGNAAADILFGDVNPSGKLTITFPRSVGEVPDYYDYKPGARLFNYVDESTKPLFPFGFGMSYTSFVYSDPTLSSSTMPRDGQVTLSTTITNSGSVAGDEIVQLYTHQKVSSVTRPVKELKGFQRITLAAGQSQTVTFNVKADSLAFHDIHMNLTTEPGEVELMVGSSSAQLKTATVRLTQ
jgi:beta-glucosidase